MYKFLCTYIELVYTNFYVFHTHIEYICTKNNVKSTNNLNFCTKKFVYFKYFYYICKNKNYGKEKIKTI